MLHLTAQGGTVELWQTRKRYRELSRRVHQLGPTHPHVALAAEPLMTTLLLGDRLETEASVLKLALRAAKARLRRSVLWVATLSRIQQSALSLARRDDATQAEMLERELQRLGADDIGNGLHQVRLEVSHVEGRIAELKDRVVRVSEVAEEQLRHLMACITIASTPPREV